MKVIDHIDANAAAWIEATMLVCAAFADAESTRASLSQAGDVQISKGRLKLPLHNLEHPDLAKKGAAFGSLWLIPGVRETLRINGRIETVDAESYAIRVEECYIHCGKALIRSDFWAAEPQVNSPRDFGAQLSEARFVAVATSNAAGEADLSPKGDPSGMMVQLIGDDLCLAERPGNRRADSLRNILVQPHIALLVLSPGSSQVTTITGTASISTDPALLECFAVGTKLPSLVVRVSNLAVETGSSRVLEHAALWPQEAKGIGPDPAAVIAAHMGSNRRKGFSAWLLRTLIKLPGFVRKSLDSDYQKRLY